MNPSTVRNVWAAASRIQRVSGRRPTFRAIQQATGVPSLHTVHGAVAALEAAEYVRRDGRQRRGVLVVVPLVEVQR